MKLPTSILNVVCPYLIVFCIGLMSHQLTAQAISCHSHINISLDSACASLVLPTDVLSFSNGGDYELMLTTEDGYVIDDNIVRDSLLWTDVTAKVSQSGNSCWGIIHVEDKLGPSIDCPSSIELNCHELEEYLPTASDLCSGEATIILAKNAVTELECNPNYVKLLDRTYRATDGFGNVSTCSQTISLLPIDTSLIVWPSDIDLTCTQVTLTNGIPDVSQTGIPYLPLANGENLNLYPYSDQDCSLSMDYRDVVTTHYGCKRIIMRTWIINDWNCGATSTNINPVQKIQILDSEPPNVDCGDAFVSIPISGGQQCAGSFDIELPAVEDDCSIFSDNQQFEIDIQYPGGFENDATSGFSVELTGTSTITYVVYDDCGNSATCTQEVTVDDNVHPVAVCDSISVISLRNDGTAVARHHTFDNGSFDNCESTMTVIRRTNSNTDCPCDPSGLEGFEFIGEQSGRYFYLSEAQYNINRARSFATALDGNLAVINSPEVVGLLEEQLDGMQDSIYIGLSASALGGYIWSDHTQLSGVTNWDQVDTQGNPLSQGNYVILNEDRRWELVSGEASLPFILEVVNPCVFAETVEFCCADASALGLPIVELRVIDGDGNYSSCNAEVLLQDKNEAVANCPENMTINCSDNIDFTDNAIFGDFSYTDNCLRPTILGPTIDDSQYNSLCNSGTVLRKFYAMVSETDSVEVCTQVLTAMTIPFDSTSIHWPDDLTVTGCAGDDFSPEALEALGMFGRVSPTLTEPQCGSVTDDDTKDWPFTSQVVLIAGTCSQIIRTWTVIDWCGDLVDGAPPTYERQQVINITESEKPELLRPTCDMEVFSATNCVNGVGTANFNFSVFSQDNCSSPTATITERLFYSGPPTLVASNIPSGGTFASNTVRPNGYPIGDHRFIVTLRDDCGNEDSCEKIVRVLDDAPPVVTPNQLSIPIQLWNGVPMVVLNANTLAEVQYGCSVYTPRFSFSSSESITDSTLMCDDLTTNPVPVTVYVQDDFGLDTAVVAHISVTQLQLCNSNPANFDVRGVILGTDSSNEAFFDGCTDTGFSQLHCENLVFAISGFDRDGVCQISNVSVSVDFNSDGVEDFEYAGDGSSSFILNTSGGNHTLIITVEGCGQSFVCTRQFDVDCLDQSELSLDFCESTEDINRVINCNDNGPILIDARAVSTNDNCTTNENFVSGQIDYFGDGVDVQSFGSLEQLALELDPIVGSHLLTIIATNCTDTIGCTRTLNISCQQQQNSLHISECQIPATDVLYFECENENLTIPFSVTDALGLCDVNDFTLTVEADFGDNGQDVVTYFGNGNLEIDVVDQGTTRFFITAEGCNGLIDTCSREIEVECVDNLLQLESCSNEEHSYNCNFPIVYDKFISATGGIADCDVELEAVITYPTGETELIVGVDFIMISINPELTGFGLYTYEVTTDFDCGISQGCSGSVLTFCENGISQNTIGGSVLTESAEQVADVEILLQGSSLNAEYTDDEGNYAFADMPDGGTYKVKAQKDIDPLDGVSTLDLILIQRHVLGVDPITSPYKLIAADIDRSGTINGIDLIELRKLILGVYDDFPRNNSWRIVDASQDLGTDPFEVVIQEEYLVHQIVDDMQIDFVGVKVGDVDQSYTYFNSKELNSRSSDLELVLEDARLEAGVEKAIIVSSKDFPVISGLQFDLNVDTDRATVLNVVPLNSQLSDANFNLQDGSLSTVWHQAETVELSEELFEILLLPYEDASISEVLSLGQNRIRAEAYTSTETIGLQLSMDQVSLDEKSEMILFHNQPNPWRDYTEIKYYLPEVGSTVLSIFDISGKLIYKEERVGQKGMNSVMLSKESLNSNGVLYYELVSDRAKQTHKMILID